MLYIKSKQRRTQELGFLEKFIESNFFSNFIAEDENFMLLQEPFTGFGYTDLVCIIWRKNSFDDWNTARNYLLIDDIRILHHLYRINKYKSALELRTELGFSQKKIISSLLKLLDAGLISSGTNDKYKICKKSDIFHIKKIVSIEAKLKDWRRALNQTINNFYHSSESYTLFPESKISDRIIENYNQYDVGIISFNESSRILKQSKKNTIPATFNSWLFNEYIGRTLYGNRR
jgi:predicted transcriptional regulator